MAKRANMLLDVYMGNMEQAQEGYTTSIFGLLTYIEILGLVLLCKLQEEYGEKMRDSGENHKND